MPQRHTYSQNTLRRMAELFDLRIQGPICISKAAIITSIKPVMTGGRVWKRCWNGGRDALADLWATFNPEASCTTDYEESSFFFCVSDFLIVEWNVCWCGKLLTLSKNSSPVSPSPRFGAETHISRQKQIRVKDGRVQKFCCVILSRSQYSTVYSASVQCRACLWSQHLNVDLAGNKRLPGT